MKIYFAGNPVLMQDSIDIKRERERDSYPK